MGIRKLLHPNQPSNETLENENVAQDPPSVAAPVRKPKSPPPQMNNKHTPTSPVNHTVKRMPAMPITNESPVHPPVSKVTNGHKKSKSGSGMILENFNHGRVVEDDQRMRERRRSATARKPVGSSERRDSQPHVGDLVRGVNGLQV